uniref:Uncharacterized protein n=3 Tax=Lygus hesperus TaxID=30085 RepID=A0A146L4Y0_LYGHE
MRQLYGVTDVDFQVLYDTIFGAGVALIMHGVYSKEQASYIVSQFYDGTFMQHFVENLETKVVDDPQYTAQTDASQVDDGRVMYLPQLLERLQSPRYKTINSILLSVLPPPGMEDYGWLCKQFLSSYSNPLILSKQSFTASDATAIAASNPAFPSTFRSSAGAVEVSTAAPLATVSPVAATPSAIETPKPSGPGWASEVKLPVIGTISDFQSWFTTHNAAQVPVASTLEQYLQLEEVTVDDTDRFYLYYSPYRANYSSTTSTPHAGDGGTGTDDSTQSAATDPYLRYTHHLLFRQGIHNITDGPVLDPHEYIFKRLVEHSGNRPIYFGDTVTAVVQSVLVYQDPSGVGDPVRVGKLSRVDQTTFRVEPGVMPSGWLNTVLRLRQCEEGVAIFTPTYDVQLVRSMELSCVLASHAMYS